MLGSYVPAYRSVIKYTDGTYIEQRFKKVLTQSYDWDRKPIDVTSYTDWKVKEDTCNRLLRNHDVVKTKTETCKKAGDIGSMNYESLEKYYKQDFATYGYERTYESSNQFVRRGKWKLKSNTCYTPAPPARPTPPRDPCANVHGGRDDAKHNRCVLNNRGTNGGGNGGGKTNSERNGNGHGPGGDMSRGEADRAGY